MSFLRILKSKFRWNRWKPIKLKQTNTNTDHRKVLATAEIDGVLARGDFSDGFRIAFKSPEEAEELFRKLGFPPRVEPGSWLVPKEATSPSE